MNGFETSVAFIAVLLSLSIPIVAIIMEGFKSINKKKQEAELRKAIIESNVDPESIKLLVEEPDKKKKNDPYSTLRSALICMGICLGALANYLLHISSSNMFFWCIIACGVGIGMLISFVIEYQLSKKNKEQLPAENEKTTV